MKHVLVIGAGKSTGVLIEYLLSQAERDDWSVKVVDRSADAARRRVGDHPRGTTETFDASDGPQRDKLVSASDLVVSMVMGSPYLEAACCGRTGFNYAPIGN